MALSPTRCESCRAFALKPLGPDGSAECECGHVTRALAGGGGYSAADHSLFDAIVATLYASGLTPPAAAKLLLELDACADRSPLFKLGWLTQLSPPLSIIELIVGPDLLTAHKAVAMMGAVLEAMKSDDRASGFITRVASNPGVERRR